MHEVSESSGTVLVAYPVLRVTGRHGTTEQHSGFAEYADRIQDGRIADICRPIPEGRMEVDLSLVEAKLSPLSPNRRLGLELFHHHNTRYSRRQEIMVSLGVLTQSAKCCHRLSSSDILLCRRNKAVRSELVLVPVLALVHGCQAAEQGNRINNNKGQNVRVLVLGLQIGDRLKDGFTRGLHSAP